MRNAPADDLIAFLNASPSPWHAVETAVTRLVQGGAIRLREEDVWSLHPGDTVFVTRGGSIAALRIPENFSVRNPRPYHIIAAHTDSPGLRLKPRAPQTSHAYRQWGVEVYGGVLYNSWLDRDLGIAGRVYPNSATASPGKLVRFEDQPLRIPQVAIHLDRTVNEQGLVLNPQRHLIPVAGQKGGSEKTSLEAHLEAAAGAPFPELSFDLCLYDTTPAGYGGLGDEFIYSGRLDNLAMCHAALSAFVSSPPSDKLQIVVLFDHEEIGSVSAEGARSNFLPALLERAVTALGLDREGWLRLLPQSFLISADMAHALHPNYPEKHEPDHFPLMNRGVVLKANASHRYMGDAPTASRILGWAQRAGVPMQNFVSRSDLACGSTVGPALGAELGMPGVDLGNAMLSMHSAREMCGADDPAAAISLFREFFRG